MGSVSNHGPNQETIAILARTQELDGYKHLVTSCQHPHIEGYGKMAQIFSWQPKMDMTWWHDMNVFNVFRTDDDFCRNGPAFFWAPKGAWDVHVEIAAPGSQEDRSGAEGWQNQCRWFHRVKPGGGSAGSPSRSAGCTVKIDKLYIYIYIIYIIYTLW